jgi:hypothetical protein
MFATEELVKATVQMKEAEAARLSRQREARVARREAGAKGWRWRIEPGMEESFRYLLGWLIPSRNGDANGEQSSESKAA